MLITIAFLIIATIFLYILAVRNWIFFISWCDVRGCEDVDYRYKIKTVNTFHKDIDIMN